MILKFTLVSDEVADFRREIDIDGNATFFDLHKIIIACSGFDEPMFTAFFLCDEYWKKKEEITLVEMEIRSDWLDEEKQKMIFMFDYHAERGFYMELSEVIFGENISKPICTNKKGVPPAQFIEEEEEDVDSTEVIIPPLILDDDIDLDGFDEEDDEEEVEDDSAFYGDEEFSDDELEMDGFEDINGADNNLDMPDERSLF